MAQIELAFGAGHRAAFFAVAALLVILLVWAVAQISVRQLPPERVRSVSIVTERKTPQRVQAENRAIRSGAPSPAAGAEPATPSEDAIAMRRVLSCLTRSREEKERPPDCPPLERLKPLESWERPLGAPRREFTNDEMYTRSWQRTMIIPCTAGTGDGVPVRCKPGFGATPPPPTKTPEEYCLDANLGGPCKPPPQKYVVPEASR